MTGKYQLSATVGRLLGASSLERERSMSKYLSPEQFLVQFCNSSFVDTHKIHSTEGNSNDTHILRLTITRQYHCTNF